MPVRVGDVLEDRFTLEAKAGSGGMGTVWRAHDRVTGQAVALKLLRDPDTGDASRFIHEAQVLATLSHPHIVRHVGHGFLAADQPFLAMEWLDGMDVGQRLAERGLTVDESLALVQRASTALGFAHASGIVHRDIKPSNLFLVAGDVTAIKILDFGIVRISSEVGRRTQTGSVLGTPGYMAPEQARGERAIKPAADVFSLGCVLFECLTGQPAFQGTHALALLAKLLLEDPPDIRELRPNLSAPLAELVSHMLAKDPAKRPRDGAAVSAALASLGTDHRRAAVHGSVPATLTSTERRLVSIMVAAPEPGPEPAALQPTISVTSGGLRGHVETVRRAIELMGAKFELLVNGMFVAMLVGAGNPMDQTTVVARCALQLRALLPGATIALMTGRGDTSNRLPVGDVLDKVAALVDAPVDHVPGIRVDDVTRTLLDTRFELIEDRGHVLLRRERSIGEEPRTLLGKPSPFVGRDRELRSLREQIAECFEEPSAQAILVTGPPGIGKSRLRQVLVQQLFDAHPQLACVVGRADSHNAGAFAPLGAALRGWLGIEVGEPLARQQDKLASGVRRYISGEDSQRVIDFIGELVGVPFAAEQRPRLLGARRDPQVMAAQIELAYVDLIRSIADKQPILLVLEDLHWSDAATVRLLDVALRELSDRPFVLLAFARPEVRELFPRLWSGRGFTALGLAPLHRRAARQLVRSVLGDPVAPSDAQDGGADDGPQTISAETIASIIERSGGNAFYLEELIRAVASGHTHELPDSVLGMVEARLDGLPTESRRLLRAASIFGEVFWARGLRALLGSFEASTEEILAELVEQEFLIRRNTRQFAGQDEFGFRHALVRDGAYAMLTEQDRTLGHKLAGQWLELAGEQDPAVLAKHFELGAEPAKAAHWYVSAADQLLCMGDPDAALAVTDRALALGPADAPPGQLWGVRAEAAFMTGGAGFSIAVEAAHRAIQARSDRHGQALYGGIGAALLSHQVEAAQEFMALLLTAEPDPAQLFPLACAFSMAVPTLIFSGQRDAAALYLERLQTIIDDSDNVEPGVLARQALTKAHWEYWVQRDAWASLQLYARARQQFELIGDQLNALSAASWQIMCYPTLGAFEDAEQLIASCRRHRLMSTMSPVSQGLTTHVTYGELERDQPERAIQTALPMLQSGDLRPGELTHTNLNLLLAEAYLLLGELEQAEQALEQSGAAASGLWVSDMAGRGLRARLLLARGAAREAAQLAEQIITQCRRAGVYDWFRFATTLLTRAQALHAAGDPSAAAIAIADARDDLLARAAKIEDPRYRRCFLARVPAHAHTLALADEWLGPVSAPIHSG